jgi:hypothetical protein
MIVNFNRVKLQLPFRLLIDETTSLIIMADNDILPGPILYNGMLPGVIGNVVGVLGAKDTM